MKIQFRHLPRERREELIQEAIARACVAYHLLAAKGKLYLATPSSLATYASRQASAGSHVGGKQDTAKDPLSPACQRRHGLEVLSYQRHRVPVRSGSGGAGWQQLTIADRKYNIPELAAFRLSLPDVRGSQAGPPQPRSTKYRVSLAIR